MSHKRLIDVEQLRDLIEVQRLQHRIASEITGIPVKKMTKFCRRYGIKTQRTGPRDGEGHPEWNGGELIDRHGYISVYSPGHPYARKPRRKYVLKHRLVMESKLGRYLLPSEVVHHIDANPQNNDPSNLIVFQTNSKHLKEELTGRVPKWTDLGKKNISIGNKGMNNQEKSGVAALRKATRCLLKFYDSQKLQLSDHP